MITFLICLALLITAYITYGRYLDRVCDIDPSHPVPLNTKRIPPVLVSPFILLISALISFIFYIMDEIFLIFSIFTFWMGCIFALMNTKNMLFFVVEITLLLIMTFSGTICFPIYCAYQLWGKYALILPLQLLLFVFFYFLFGRIIVKTALYTLSILLRKFIYLEIWITSIVFLIPGICCFLDSQVQHNLSFDTCAMGIISILFWVNILVITIYKELKRTYLFKNYRYYRPSYILYLRRFAIDGAKHDISILETLSNNKFKLSVMKIGNPRTIFANSLDYDTVYLQEKNWKKPLEEYIKHSKLVFVQLDTSEGVIWEAFYNFLYLNKYIYYISDVRYIQSLLEIITTREELKHAPILAKTKKFLSQIDIKYNSIIVFAFDNNSIIYSDKIDDIIYYKINNSGKIRRF